MGVSKQNRLLPAVFAGLCLLLICVLFPVNANANIYIIANPSVQQDTLSKSDIKKIFMGEKIKWSEYLQVLPVTVGDYNVHEEFTKKFVHKTPSQFAAYWRTVIFSGRGVAPENVRTVDEVINYVANNKGAIGYTSVKPAGGNVKVIQVIDN